MPALSLLLSLNPSSSEDGVPALSLNPSDSLMPESSGPWIPSVVIDVVKNPGKTNASIPSMLTTVCSKAIGWFWSSPYIETSNVKIFPSILRISNNNLIPLKINSNVSPSAIPSFISSKVNLNSNFPSLTVLKSNESIFTWASDGGSCLDLSFDGAFAIMSSVNLGFNKVSSVGRPATSSHEAISIDIKFIVVSAKLQINSACFISKSPSSTASLIVHFASTGVPLPCSVIKKIIKVNEKSLGISWVVKPKKLKEKAVGLKPLTCLNERWTSDFPLSNMIDDNSLLSLNKPASSDNNPLFESNILSDSSSEENLSETSLASQALNSTVKSSPTVRSEPSTVIW